MAVIDKLAWIYISNKKIVSTRSKGKSVYFIPGGKRECNETDTEALIREIKEELNVNLIEPSIQYFGTFKAPAHGYDNGITVKMTCYLADYVGNLKASAEIAEIKWLKYADRTISSEVDKLIFDKLVELSLID